MVVHRTHSCLSVQNFYRETMCAENQMRIYLLLVIREITFKGKRTIFTNDSDKSTTHKRPTNSIARS